MDAHCFLLPTVIVQVVSQFRMMCSSPDPSTIEDTYVMGHRLIAFLSQALPRHPEYMARSSEKYRNRMLKALVWINNRMDDIALKIDEDQLNRYITNDFNPQPDLDDGDDEGGSTEDESRSTSSSEFHDRVIWSLEDLDGSDSSPNKNDKWESFQGWHFDISSSCSSAAAIGYSDLPLVADTDTSSCSELNASRDMYVSSDSELEQEFDELLVRASEFPHRVPREKQELDGEHHDPYVEDTSKKSDQQDYPEFYGQDEEEDAFCLDDIAYNEMEDEDEDELHCEREDEEDDDYRFRDALQVSEFLRRVADEEVRYEDDSEANDSWAQDNGDAASEALSCASSSGVGGEALTCDPARMAFREIMNAPASRKPTGSPQRRAHLPLPPPPPPRRQNRRDSRSSSALSEESASWASFDFASVRRSQVVSF